ncbi:MAG TPA: hypothetical protein VEF90_17685 [Xanthobacteraceae bacterium]|nr:hypothetical protein [Xanthobacteraceae bacterium]
MSKDKRPLAETLGISLGKTKVVRGEHRANAITLSAGDARLDPEFWRRWNEYVDAVTAAVGTPRG